MSSGTINYDESKLSALDIKQVNYNLKNDPLPEEYHLVVFEDSQFNANILSKISSALTSRGFLLLIENASSKCTISSSVDLQQVAVIENNGKKYFLLKKVSGIPCNIFN